MRLSVGGREIRYEPTRMDLRHLRDSPFINFFVFVSITEARKLRNFIPPTLHWTLRFLMQRNEIFFIPPDDSSIACTN